jgi:hypothetical protein
LRHARNNVWQWTLVFAVLGLGAGCGHGNGPQRYNLSGAVTYAGQPVPAGIIVFEPDDAAGNQGPGTVAEFSGGRYYTPRGRGTVGGPHVVRIIGYTAQPEGGDDSTGARPLFEEYKTQVDLPQSNASHDFHIPADHR